MQNTAIKFNLSLMDNDTILKNVYLADHEKNMEIFAALMQGKEAINKYLPNHFGRLKLCCMEVCTLLSSPDIHNFILEDDIRAGFPFLMLDGVPEEGTILSNRMNYADEKVGPLEASMVANVLAYSYLCEQSGDEDEQYFAAFMVDYLKMLASYNRSNKKFSSSAFTRIID
ncbi:MULTISPECIES: hypothetical protein [Acinetobacter]|uniref:hypothetical protein n=1 Tax=Acinetobacter TaxID=469 RepID=UPI00028DD466|nr:MULTISPECIES: hypothetical protein [Acinetobacter]EKU3442026.1 hypothetical protein [Acinetobacter baumannii]MDP7848865.1 hypothetical protein [Acinetobacter baumannii]BBL22213.1 hypothetical protein ACRAD_28840 [Acinetobacter radioresistens DSM 6976 = NBRC 102413 = CIP 103788]